MIVLPYDKSDNSYNYSVMIDLLFGKAKLLEL